MEEIAGGKGRKRVWHSNRKAGAPKDSSRPQSQREFKAQLKALARRADEAGKQIGGTREAGEKACCKTAFTRKVGCCQGGAQKRASVPRGRSTHSTHIGAFTRRLAGLHPAEPRHAA